MIQSQAVARYVNTHLPELSASIDKLGGKAIEIVQATLETDPRDQPTFVALSREAVDSMNMLLDKAEKIKDLVVHGDEIYMHSVEIKTCFTQLISACATFFREASGEEQEQAVQVLGKMINEIKMNFDGINGIFAQPLKVKEGARLPEESVAMPAAPAVTATPGIVPRLEKAASATLSKKHPSAPASFFSTISKDSFLTRQPSQWSTQDVHDFLLSWIALDPESIQRFQGINGEMLMKLTQEQILGAIPDQELARSLIETLDDIRDETPHSMSTISASELHYMTDVDIYNGISQTADAMAEGITRFTDGWINMQPVLPPMVQIGPDETAVEVAAPPESPEQQQQRQLMGRATAEEAVKSIQMHFYDIVYLIQGYCKKVTDKFLVQDLLASVNKFEITSVQFHSGISALITSPLTDQSVRLQLQATARTFAAAVLGLLEELARIHKIREENKQKAEALAAKMALLHGKAGVASAKGGAMSGGAKLAAMFQPPTAGGAATGHPRRFKQYRPVGFPDRLTPLGRVQLAATRNPDYVYEDILPDSLKVNIWREREYNRRCVLFDGAGSPPDQMPVRAGTLNQLIMRLTNPRVSEPDFMKTFIMTYHSFTTPENFFLKLMERYYIPDGWDLEDSIRKGMQLKVINVLKKWVLERFRDFNDTMQLNVKNFAAILTSDGNSALAQQIENAMDRMSAEVQTKNDNLLSVSNGLFLKVKHVGKKNESPQQYLSRLKAQRLAENLTLIEYRIFRNIQPVELLGKAWSKSDGKMRSPNVMALINRFNTVSSWVASSVLWCDKLKERAKMYSKLVKMMKHLWEVKNYNCAMAVLAGLNNSAIHRLRLTHAEVPQKIRDIIADVSQKLSSDSSYSAYRQTLRSSAPPAIPYLGMYLTDLTFIEDGNPDDIMGLINFKKRDMVYRVIEEMSRFQLTEYGFKVDHPILTVVQDLPYSSDDELYQLSLQREPRGSNRDTIY